MRLFRSLILSLFVGSGLLNFSSAESSKSNYALSTSVSDLLNKIEANKINFNQFIQANNNSICWKDTYGRGVGVPIYACDSPLEKDGLLCYPPCKDNYYGVGPVCWEHCEDGYTDEGALCSKAGSIVPSDNSACPWYDKCGLIEAKGCSKCPNDEGVNDGCTCRIDPIVKAKNSYGRGAGTPLGCGSQQYDAGLCYDYCKSNYTNVGPVCWENCPSVNFPFDEGAICCLDQKVCDQKVDEMAKAVLTALAEAIEAGSDLASVLKALKAAIEAALGFVLPLCDDF